MVKLLLLLPIALLMLTPAHATPPTTLTGTAKTLTFVTTETRTADGNTFLSATITGVLSGGLEGTDVGTNDIIILSSGQVILRADVTFTGTVNGSGPGTASITSIAQGTMVSGGGGDVAFQGQFVIGNGTGGLAGLHGEGTVQHSPGSVGSTYSVLVHFDPA